MKGLQRHDSLFTITLNINKINMLLANWSGAHPALKNSESFQEESEETNNQNICWKLKTSFMDDKQPICVACHTSQKAKRAKVSSTEKNETQLQVTFGKLTLCSHCSWRWQDGHVQTTPSVRGKTASFHSNQTVKSPSVALGQNESSWVSVAYQKVTARDWIIFFNVSVLSVSFQQALHPYLWAELDS